VDTGPRPSRRTTGAGAHQGAGRSPGCRDGARPTARPIAVTALASSQRATGDTLGPRMADQLVTGLIGIGGTIAGGVVIWFLGRRAKESDDLRNIYAAWAAEAHNVVATIVSTREGAEVTGRRAAGLSTDYVLDAINNDPRQWAATGIDRANAALEKARFNVVLSDGNERRVQAVVEETAHIAQLHPMMSYDKLDAAKKELEGVVTTKLRSSFRLRSLLDD
jgi:hypothetical protein